MNRVLLKAREIMEGPSIRAVKYLYTLSVLVEFSLRDVQGKGHLGSSQCFILRSNDSNHLPYFLYCPATTSPRRVPTCRTAL